MPDFDQMQRQKLAAKKQAMPDGGFPIRNVADLKNAIQAFGRAKNKPAVKAWIKKRARELGATNLLPDNWRDDTLVQNTVDKMEVNMFTHNSDYPDYVCHYGVKGMKWGVRRYQDKNGNYTAAGLMRLRKDVKAAQKRSSKERVSGRSKGSTGKNYDEAEKKIRDKMNKFNSKWGERVERELSSPDLYDTKTKTFDSDLLDTRLRSLSKKNMQEEISLRNWMDSVSTQAKLKDIGLSDSEARRTANWLREKRYKL